MIIKALIAVLTVLVTFALFAGLVLIKKRQEERLKKRMTSFSDVSVKRGRTSAADARRLGGMRARAQGKAQKKSPKEQFLAFVQKHSKRLPRAKLQDKLNVMMEQADWPLFGRDYEVIALLLGALCSLVTMLLTMQPSFALLAFPGGILLAWMYLRISIQRRQKAFMNQLGGMLEMSANALRSGFSFIQAFELISREMDAPIGRESEKVLREINLGSTMETALEHMQQRVQSPDFELVVTAVLIQRQVGGNLADILDTISYTIQERVRMRREVLALTAQGRLTGVVLALLPFALGGFLYVGSPGYLDPLFTDPIGHIAIGVALIMIALGFIVIRKIVDIKA